MDFLFVDRILSHSDTHIVARKCVSRSDPLFYWLPSGERVLSPAVVSESLAQAGNWLIMKRCDFLRRAVPIFDEKTEYHDPVMPGDELELRVAILRFDGDIVETEGAVYVNGRCVQSSRHSRGFLVPSQDYDDPQRLQRYWQILNSHKPISTPSPSQISQTPTEALPPAAGIATFDQLSYIDKIIAHAPFQKVIAQKNVTSAETYFREHFPRKPIVPGVMLMTFLGETCQYLLKTSSADALRGKALIPRHASDVHFRKFCEPGDILEFSATVEGSPVFAHGADINVSAQIHCQNKRVLSAKLGFRLDSGCKSFAHDGRFGANAMRKSRDEMTINNISQATLDPGKVVYDENAKI